jgi:hypothetical protein
MTVPSGATWDTVGYNFTLSGGVTVASGGTLKLYGNNTTLTTPTLNTGSTVEYYGTTNSTLKNWSYKNLTINSTASSTVFTFPTNETSLATTTISSGILSLGGYNFTTTSFINNDTLRLQGNETLSFTNDTDSGTVEYVGDGDTVADSYTLKNLTYYNLVVNSTDVGDTFQIPSSTLNINGSFILNRGVINEFPASMVSPDATGGTITYSGGNIKHTFTTNGTFTPNKILSTNALVVAGGGGGGGSTGGGGGGGGVISTSSLSVTAQAYTITVGNGGSGGSSTRGSNGNNSVFSSLTAVGGGGGGSNGGTTAALSGGSGGGGSNGLSGASGTSGQGYAGGNSGSWSGYYACGGGGGAGAIGTNGNSASAPGPGGDGFLSSISGIATYYGGGGGGGVYQTVSGANGGQGGGGHGGTSGGVGLTSGTVNTGGGGGGQGGNSGVAGGNGGSGIVIISYTPSVIPTLVGGAINVAGNFTQTGGTFNITTANLNLIGTNQTISLSATTTIAGLSKVLAVGSTTNQTLSFANSSTTPLIITGTTTLRGVSGDGLTLKLRSTATDTPWFFNPQGGRSFQYIDVQDSTNINAVEIESSAITGFVDSGNNVGWGSAAAVLTVGESGRQLATTTAPVNDQALGGAFTLNSADGDSTITSITLKQVGSVATTSLSNITLVSKEEETCSTTTPTSGTTPFGSPTDFTDDTVTIEGNLTVTDGVQTCLYVNYDLGGEVSTSTMGRSIDFEITNPSTDLVIEGGTVNTTSKVNITGRTMITTPDGIESLLSLKTLDENKNPTLFYLKDNSVWKQEGTNPPRRLTNPNLKVQTLTFQDLTGVNNSGSVRIIMTISNVDPDAPDSFLNVTRTYSSSAAVRAWQGND